MMRTVKILSLAVGGIIALMVVLLLAVWLLVNPNDYKGRIAAAVKQSTGRELILKGELKLSVFPWVALELGPASLGNPPGFSEEPFLAFNHAAVRVSLMGLLHKRLTINRIDIDGLDVRLRKNAQGTGNWQDFGQERATDKKAPAESNGGLPLELEGIKVSNGRVSYPGLDVQKFNLDVGAYSGHGVTPIGIAFEANRGVPDENVSVNAKFELGMDSRDKPVHLAAVNLSGLVSQPGDGRPVHWEMTAASIDVDSKAQTLAAPAFTMSYSGAKITGSLQATKFIDDLSLTGSVTLAPLVLHEFAPRLGVTLPKTKDPRALKELSASTDLSYGAAGLRLEKLQAQLDDTTLKGTLSFAGEPRGVKFELAVDQVDADRYLSPQEPV
jgi:AsmA protein